MTDTMIDEEEGAAPPPADGELTAKQELALRAVLSHPTLKEAAAAAGVSDVTLWRYMKEEAFARRLREARREAVTHAVTRLQQGTAEAVAVLRELMLKEGAPAAARISAARFVLDYSFRLAEVGELRARVDELEESIRLRREADASFSLSEEENR